MSAEVSASSGEGLLGGAVQPLTLLLALVAGALHLLPAAADLLAWDRVAIAQGEWWRLVSGHWVHWSNGHLVWDLGAFVVLGVACERRGRGRFVACLVAAVLAIGAALWWCCPELERYGGLSGIDSALYVLLVAELLADAVQGRRAVPILVSVALLLGFASKVLFEVSRGEALFVADLGAGVVPVALAHLAGAVVGGAVANSSRLFLISPAAERYAGRSGPARGLPWTRLRAMECAEE